MKNSYSLSSFYQLSRLWCNSLMKNISCYLSIWLISVMLPDTLLRLSLFSNHEVPPENSYRSMHPMHMGPRDNNSSLIGDSPGRREHGSNQDAAFKK